MSTTAAPTGKDTDSTNPTEKRKEDNSMMTTTTAKLHASGSDVINSTEPRSSALDTSRFYNQTQTQLQSSAEQQFQVVDRAIDHTKDNVRKSIEEVRREIPEYAQSVSDYHQQAMDSAQEITDNFLESQRNIINSVESSWTSYLETVYWWLSPRKLAEIYAQSMSNLADNSVSASRIWNKVVLANMDASKSFLRRASEASKDLSKINANTARTFERTSSQIRDTTVGNNERYQQ
jgi:hypothetical protein